MTKTLDQMWDEAEEDMQRAKAFGRKASWQIIFRTREGLDYCRESLPSFYPKDKAKQVAAEMLATAPDRERCGLYISKVEAW